MASGGTYRRFESWQAGDGTDRTFEIGSHCTTNRDRPVGLGLLRIGYFGNANLAAVDAYLKIADDGTEIGPIDVPFSIVVEEPVHVLLRPVAAPSSELRVVLSVTPVLGYLQTDSARRTIVAVLNQIIQLPQWVKGVTALAPATIQFRDRTAITMNTAASGTLVRPDSAVDVIASAAGTILLHY